MKIPTITTGKTVPFTEAASTSSTSHQQKESFEGFQPGQLLKAKVLAGSAREGNVLLEVAGRKVSAKSLVRLVTGDNIWLEVNQGGSSPSLSLASKKGAVHHFLEILFTSPRRPDTLLQQLAPLLNQVDSGTKDPALLPLARLMAGLAGLGQGAKPDPAAVQLIALLYGGFKPGPGGGSDQELLQHLNNLLNWEKLSPSIQKLLREALDLVDKHQQVNTSSPARDDSTFFLFPCFFKEEAGWGEWMFSKSPDTDSDPSSFELTFFLEMSKLGPLSLHLSGNDKSIQGSFQLSEPQAVDFMKARILELQQLLLDLGYKEAHFQCLQGRVDVLMEMKDSLMRHAGLNRFNLVDITA